MKKRILFLLCVISIGSIFLLFHKARAVDDSLREEILKINDDIVARKQDILDLNKKIDDLKNAINKKHREAATLENQIQIIGNRAAELALDIEAREKEIEEKQLEIETLEIEIREKDKLLQDEKQLISEIIRRLYKVSGSNYIEAFFLRENISDFFNEVALLEHIETNLAEEIKKATELYVAIDTRKKAIELNKKNLEETRAQLEGKHLALREAQSAKEILAQTAIQNARVLADNLTEILKQKDAIDAEVFNLQSKIQQKLNTSDKFAFSGNIILSWPVPNQGIMTLFHDPDYPFRNFFEHTGIDIRTLRNGRPTSGLAVRAAAPGIVVKAVRNSIYGGNILYIAHAGSITTVYMHLSSMIVAVGDEVARGDVVAYSGGLPGLPSSGRFTTGPHLHFEVRKNGIPVNPLDYLINF